MVLFLHKILYMSADPWFMFPFHLFFGEGDVGGVFVDNGE